MRLNIIIALLSIVLFVISIFLIKGNSKEGYAKEGYAKACLNFTDQDVCKQIGCNWNSGLNLCMGTPKPCSEYNQSNCNDNVGCAWMEVITDNGKSYTCMDA